MSRVDKTHPMAPCRSNINSGSLVLLSGGVPARLCTLVNPISRERKVSLQQSLASCVLISSDYHGSIQFGSGPSQDC